MAIIANMHSHYQASDAATLVGKSVDRFVRLGQIIEPDGASLGKGHKAGYSFRNLVEAIVADTLISFGVPPKRIQKYLVDLRSSHSRWLDRDGNSGWIVLDSEWNWAAGSTLGLAMKLLKKPHALIALNIEEIKKQIR